MTKIAVLHPAFSLGGAAAVAMWAVEALKADNEVDLVTTEPVDIEECNTFFGTTIRVGEIRVLGIPPLGPEQLHGVLVKVASAERYYRRSKMRYDLAIATRCEMDLGGFGIQYMHCPIWDDRVLRAIGQLPPGWRYRRGPLRWTYRHLAVSYTHLRAHET